LRRADALSARLHGGLYGLLIGDALGVPYEFHPPDRLPPKEQIEMRPPEGFRRAHSSVPPGTWSDDGAQALCLLASLQECGRLELADLGKRLLRWSSGGYLAVDGNVFDIGIQTSRALHQLQTGVAPDRSGPSEERDNGNGALMRVLPLALWHRGTDEELVRDAHEQGLVTHGHPRSQVCCGLYCLWARAELLGRDWASAVATLRRIYARHPQHAKELEEHVKPDAPPSGTGGGYVVDCLLSARLACEESSYEAVVKSAIALGHDTDTTACVAGGIAGIRHGLEGIPTRWMEALRGRDLVDPLAAQLV
jgi:ADP-ribosyl-[dinitrogen reductase] hydrolase